MNFLGISLVMIALGGIAFHISGSALITSNASAMLSIVGIMAAAILVRLNRGLPALDWKAVDKEDIFNLLDRIEKIAKAYVAIFSIAIACVLIIVGTLVSNTAAYAHKAIILTVMADAFGGLLGLLISRMFYVVWLDLDIVRLQRAVIVSAASGNEAEKQRIIAKEKIADIERVRITTL